MKLSISKYSNRFFIPCQDAISKQQKLDTILEIFGLIVGHDDAINEVCQREFKLILPHRQIDPLPVCPLPEVAKINLKKV